MAKKAAIRQILKHDYYTGVYLIILGIVSLILSSWLLCPVLFEGPQNPPPYHWPLWTLLGASLAAADAGMLVLLVKRVRRIRRVFSSGTRLPGIVLYNFYADLKGQLWRYHGGGMVVYAYEYNGESVDCWTATWRSDAVECFESDDHVEVAVDPADPEFAIIVDWYSQASDRDERKRVANRE